ncbi:DUF5617 domain-containing protein, partial [Legionella taurinensis]
IGPAGSGKSTLRLLLAGESYAEVPSLSFGTEESKFSVGNEKVSLQEAAIPPEMIKYWFKDSQALLYCVDLSLPKPHHDSVKYAIEEIEAFQRLNPDAQIILVGTHADQTKKLPETQFKEINQSFGNRFNRAVAVSMTRKHALEEDFVDNLRQDVLGPLLNVSVQVDEEMESAVVIKHNKRYPEPPKPFPKSYGQLWQKGAGPRNNLESEVGNFHAALEILRDYSKSNNPETCSFFAPKVKLALTRHLFRHHTDVVDALYKEYYNKKGATAADLINALKQRLINQGDTLNLTGSLAQRIRFIERNANLQPTDFFKLNEQIADREIPISAPK